MQQKEEEPARMESAAGTMTLHGICDMRVSPAWFEAILPTVHVCTIETRKESETT